MMHFNSKSLWDRCLHILVAGLIFASAGFHLVFYFHQINFCYDNKRDCHLVFCTFAFKVKHFIIIPLFFFVKCFIIISFVFFQFISPVILELDITSQVAIFYSFESDQKRVNLCNVISEIRFGVESFLSCWFSSFHILK